MCIVTILTSYLSFVTLMSGFSGLLQVSVVHNKLQFLFLFLRILFFTILTCQFSKWQIFICSKQFSSFQARWIVFAFSSRKCHFLYLCAFLGKKGILGKENKCDLIQFCELQFFNLFLKERKRRWNNYCKRKRIPVLGIKD